MTLLSPPHTHEVEDDTLETGALAGPAEHEIATEAYTRYLLRGCQDGHAVEDWLGAEQSLREKYGAPPSHE